MTHLPATEDWAVKRVVGRGLDAASTVVSPGSDYPRRQGVRQPCLSPMPLARTMAGRMTDVQTHAQFRPTACRLAELGVRTARRFFGRAATSRKADGTPVTDADHAAQAAILDALARDRPADAAVTEEVIVRPERHVAAGTAEYCWVVDPIDGTRNFGRGLDLWCTSVAVLHAGRPVAGAICDSTGRVYSAAAGEGLYVGGELCSDLVNHPLDADTTIAISSPRQQRALTRPYAAGWTTTCTAMQGRSACTWRGSRRG